MPTRPSPSDALEVPQQVRPAHLALFKGQIVVARIPVTHRDKAGLLSQHQLGSELAARGIDGELGPPVADQRPSPQRVSMALVAGLVRMAHRGMLQLGVQLCHWLGQTLGDQPVRL